MLIREGSLDKNSVLIFDIRSNIAHYDNFHLFKSKHLDLNSFDFDNFASQVYFKHVFIVGDAKQDFEGPLFAKFLNTVLDKEMKPFSLFLHRIKPELVTREYPMLGIVKNEKKKLTLYPMVMVKCKDVGIEKSKSRFQVLMGLSMVQRGDIMGAWAISRAILVDETDSQQVLKYEIEVLQG